MTRITVAGPLPHAVAESIRTRFDAVAIRCGHRTTVLDVDAADQPALRALLTLLWDVGQEVLEVKSSK